MKILYSLFVMTMIIVLANAQQPCKELFISEYTDGNNKNKIIELYNPSDSIIDLTNNYHLRIYKNGAPTPDIIALQGSIQPKETHVVTHPQADNTILTKAQQTDVKMNFDGNDAIVLRKGISTDVDKIGEIGVNPGNSGWVVLPNGSTKDSDLRRKLPIDKGETDWYFGKGQWNVLPKDSLQDIKIHDNTCAHPAQPSCSELFVSEYLDGNFMNKAIEIFNPTDSIKNLTDYSLQVFQNGASTPLDIPLSGNLNPKETHVVTHPQANSQLLAKADQTHVNLNFDGNDAIALKKGISTYIDKIGEIAINPGNNGWTIPPNSTTKDVNLRRKFPIDKGEGDWNNGKNQWNIHQKDSIQNFKQHLNVCNTQITHTVINDSSGTPYRYNKEILVRFKKNKLNISTIDDRGQIQGVLAEFLIHSAIVTLSQNLGFNVADLICYKVHPRMVSADTVSVTRSGKTIKITPHFATLGIFLPQSVTDSAALAIFNATTSIVDIAEYNYLAYLTIGANDPEYTNGNSAGLVSTTSIPNANINIEPAWDVETGKPNIKVGVFDSGINWEHQDFGDGTLAGSKIIGGYDYANSTPISNIASPDSFGHGSAVAGIIGAIRNNNFGVAGVAGGDLQNSNSGISLYDMKIFKMNSNCSPSTFPAPFSSIFEAMIEGAIYNPGTGFGFGQQIQNHSWGWSWVDSAYQDSLKLLKQTIITVYSNEVAFVNSSGNGAGGFNPPCALLSYPNSFKEHMIFKVGANDSTGARAGFSECGSRLDFIAPGTNNLYTSLDHAGNSLTDFFNWGNNCGPSPINGTSFAAPHASGLVALLMSYGYNNGIPNILNVDDCQYLMKKYATDIISPPNLVGYDDETGYGRINAGNTLQMINYPDYLIIHFEAKSNTPTATYDGWGVSCNESNLFGLPNGEMITNRYKITLSNNHSIPNGYSLLDAWARHSGSNLLGNNTNQIWNCTLPLNPYFLPDAPFVTLDTFTLTSATLTGYTYEIVDSSGNTVGWYPITLSDTAVLAYTLHLASQSLSVLDEKAKHSQYSIYPNPTNSKINIISDNISRFSFKIYDIFGRKVFHEENQTEINTTELNSGVYFIVITDENSSYTLKMVVTH